MITTRTIQRWAAILLLALTSHALLARESQDLLEGWRFQSGDEPNAAAPEFADAGWQKISLPHCWGWEEAQVSNKYYRGPGWYRRAIDLQPEKGKRYFVRFDAAATVADVFLNGQKLGEHRGGFGAICYELTPLLAGKGANVLAVRVSNAPEPDIAPLAGDFCVFGGLYRPAHLLVTDAVCFTPVDHASPGLAWYQSKVSAEEAILDITAHISNSGKAVAQRTLTVKLLDDQGKIVASEALPISIAAGMTPPYRIQLAVRHPHLWNGRADPYLYRAVAELSDDAGVRDSVEQRIGLRSYYVDPDKGFFLNGKSLRLKGVCRHQDVWNKGWALSNADHERDIKLILEMGANAIRCAHYQHSDYFYSLCDQAGLLVWAEIPQVNEIAAGPEFAETSRGQLLDLIRQNVNHPSIFAWSLSNELHAVKADPHRLLEDLKIVANGEDPTRPTIQAADISKWPEMEKIPDLLGWNKYPGWYHGKVEDYGPMLDELRNTSRHGGFCMSEYGAGANPLQHEENVRQPAKPAGQWHPEEWQNVVHEHAWAAIEARPFVWGSFLWNMFDFTVAGRHEGGVPSRNDKGLITTDRQLKKDAFYFYKANWSDEPVLYITSRRFTERTSALTNVKVYSNAAKVELLVNGKSLGETAATADGIFIWKQVALNPGENRIEARARRGAENLHDACDWNLAIAPATAPAAK